VQLQLIIEFNLVGNAFNFIIVKIIPKFGEGDLGKTLHLGYSGERFKKFISVRSEKDVEGL
jgi:hypothetical protein